MKRSTRMLLISASLLAAPGAAAAGPGEAAATSGRSLLRAWTQLPAALVRMAEESRAAEARRLQPRVGNSKGPSYVVPVVRADDAATTERSAGERQDVPTL